MNQDGWLGTEGGRMHVRRRLSIPQQATILFIHGLGDSGQAFNEAFDSPAMQDFNLLVPDLLGYGQSKAEQDCDCSFSAHIARLNKLIEDESRVFVVGHSMGGDLATHMASARNNAQICGIVNVEGNLTPGDRLISQQVVESEEDFDRWFDASFRQEQVLERWATEWKLRSCQNYYEALGDCRRSVFRANARELYDRNEQVPGEVESETGRVFRMLDLPKMFCWGGGTLEADRSMSEASQALLTADADGRQFPNQLFDNAFHWVMIDQSEEFYRWLATFVRRYDDNGTGVLEVDPLRFRRKVDQTTRHISDFLDRQLDGPHARVVVPAAPPEYEPLPRQGEDYEELLRALFDEHVPDSINTAGPNYLAYVPGGGLLDSALADLITNCVNRYVSFREMSPSLAMIEETVIRWFCEIVGYDPDKASGFLTSGGSIANLSAIVAARDRVARRESLSLGVIYASDQVHHSLDKAARIAGFPATAGDPNSYVRRIPSDAACRVDMNLLEDAIAEDRNNGRVPVLLVGSAGTTNSGAVDPLDQLGELAARERLWFHIDAAYGGFFALTEEGARRMQGMNRADSITLDPHKGLFLPYGTGRLLVKNPEDLYRAFFQRADYMSRSKSFADATRPLNFCDISPELSRDFRGLRVWLPIKMHGITVFKELLNEKLQLAQSMVAELRQMRHIEIVTEPQLSTLAFRLVPDNVQLESKELDELNCALTEEINSNRTFYLKTTKLRGKQTVRVCILSFRTHANHINRCLDEIRRARDLVLRRV